MTYALIQNGAVARYPYSFQMLREDHPQVSFSRDPAIAFAQAAQLGAVVVADTPRPAPSDPITKDVVELTPTLVAGVWTQTWGEADVSSEEAAERQDAATDAEQKVAIKLDSFVANFIGMTPQQVADYVDNNTANLAALRLLLKRMAVMLLLLARREFR